MKCSKCGYELKDTDMFCAKCGTKVTPAGAEGGSSDAEAIEKAILAGSGTLGHKGMEILDYAMLLSDTIASLAEFNTLGDKENGDKDDRMMFGIAMTVRYWIASRHPEYVERLYSKLRAGDAFALLRMKDMTEQLHKWCRSNNIPGVLAYFRINDGKSVVRTDCEALKNAVSSGDSELSAWLDAMTEFLLRYGIKREMNVRIDNEKAVMSTPVYRLSESAFKYRVEKYEDVDGWAFQCGCADFQYTGGYPGIMLSPDTVPDENGRTALKILLNLAKGFKLETLSEYSQHNAVSKVKRANA